jgi:hypothetical protein
MVIDGGFFGGGVVDMRRSTVEVGICSWVAVIDVEVGRMAREGFRLGAVLRLGVALVDFWLRMASIDVSVWMAPVVFPIQMVVLIVVFGLAQRLRFD